EVPMRWCRSDMERRPRQCTGTARFRKPRGRADTASEGRVKGPRGNHADNLLALGAVDGRGNAAANLAMTEPARSAAFDNKPEDGAPVGDSRVAREFISIRIGAGGIGDLAPDQVDEQARGGGGRNH